jgi:hypothetical protein
MSLEAYFECEADRLKLRNAEGPGCPICPSAARWRLPVSRFVMGSRDFVTVIPKHCPLPKPPFERCEASRTIW